MHLDLILVFLKTVLLLISFLGYGIFLHKKLRMNSSIIPLVLFCGVIGVMYLAGLLNILEQVAYFIFAAGLVLFIFYWIKQIGFDKKKNKISLKPFLTIGFCFLILFACFFALRMRNVYLVQYDNFTHWGMYVKELFRLNSLPGSHSMLLPEFKNYPPGSALFIYYICKFTGYSEARALFAQALLLGSAFAAPMVFASAKKVSHYFISIITVIVLSTIIISCMYNLLVDTLIALLFVGMLAVMTLYRDDLKRMIFVSTPILVSILLVKDIGKIFALLGICYGIIQIIGSMIKKKQQNHIPLIAMTVVCYFAVPLMVGYSWMKYYHAAFSGTQGAKFSIGMLLHPSRSKGFSHMVIVKFLQRLENLNRFDFKPVIIMTSISVLILLLVTLIRKLENKGFIGEQNIGVRPDYIIYGLVASFTVYVVYMSFLLVFYLFIMPEYEARNLAAFYRYEATVSIAVIGIQSMFLLLSTSAVHKSFRHKQFAAFTACLFLLYAPQVIKNIDTVITPPDPTVRVSINDSLKGIRLYDYDKLVVFTPIPDRDYRYYMIRYIIGSDNIGVINKVPENEKDWKKLLNKRTYILMLSPSESFLYQLKKHGTCRKLSNHLNVYKIIEFDYKRSL